MSSEKSFQFSRISFWYDFCPSAIAHAGHVTSPLNFPSSAFYHDVFWPLFSLNISLDIRSRREIPSILLSIALWVIDSDFSSAFVRDHVSLPYNIAGITVELKRFARIFFGTFHWRRSLTDKKVHHPAFFLRETSPFRSFCIFISCPKYTYLLTCLQVLLTPSDSFAFHLASEKRN